MAARLSYSGDVAGRTIFTSDLSPREQEQQIIKFIVDYADRLHKAGEEETQLICKRLVHLIDDLSYFLDKPDLLDE